MRLTPQQHVNDALLRFGARARIVAAPEQEPMRNPHPLALGAGSHRDSRVWLLRTARHAM